MSSYINEVIFNSQDALKSVRSFLYYLMDFSESCTDALAFACLFLVYL